MADTDHSNTKVNLKAEEIREEEVENEGAKPKRLRADPENVVCDLCLRNSTKNNIASFICFQCDVYLCNECIKGHESHGCLDRLSDTKDMDNKIGDFLDAMKAEVDGDELIEQDKASIVGRINVKHTLDTEDSFVTGLCGLSSKFWIICDRLNSCIKVFNSGGSYSIHRYIRLGSKPWDATEIKHDSTHVDEDIAKDSTSESLVNTQQRIAITFPGIGIMIIDINKSPATFEKMFKTDKPCYGIDFCEGKLYTICEDEIESVWCVYVMTTDGETLNTIRTEIRDFYPSICVVPDTVYLTDPYSDKVHGLDYEATEKYLAAFENEGRARLGMCMDPDGNVYICAYRHQAIYRLSSDLKTCSSVVDPLPYIKLPRALCYHRDHLFISHHREARDMRNIVTVVRLM